MLRPLLLTAPFAGLALAARVAVACTPPPCAPGHAAPADGSTIPANTPALPVLLDGAMGGGSEPLADAKLLDAQGREVAVTRVAPPLGSREALLKPTAPLAPGSYRLVRQRRCTYGGPTAPALPMNAAADQRFTVAAASPLPTTAGTLKVGAPARRPYNVTAGASCAAEVPSAVVALTLEPSPELKPFLPVARITVKANGAVWAATLPGGQSAPIPRSLYYAGRLATELFRVCETPPNVMVTDRGLATDAVGGELIVDIPGYGTLPPIPFTASLSCADVAAMTDAGPRDATPPPPDAGAPDTSVTSDAGGVDAMEPPRPPAVGAGDGGGCSFGGPAAPGGVAVLGLALLALVRRRR